MTDPAHPLAADPSDAPVLTLTGASLGVGDRMLWSGLDLELRRGEFLAVLGANGSGKTSLLRAILGQRALDEGDVVFANGLVESGDRRIGYIPQQRIFPPGVPLTGRGLVALGLDGHRFGPPFRGRQARARLDGLLEQVGATQLARASVGQLSGGEQQRLRVAQALACDPELLLCDEPLLSLDLHHQRIVSGLLDRRRREHGTAVVFVTHDVNPVLGMVDRILYLAAGRFRIGTPDEVLRSEVLSELYGTKVEVLRTAGRVVVVGIPDAEDPHHPHIADPHTGHLGVTP